MEDDIIEINQYIYFDKNHGRFYLTGKRSEIIYTKKNLILGYTGASDWVNHFVLEMMNFYTGDSPYNREIGVIDYHEWFPKMFSVNKAGLIEWVESSTKKEWGIHMYKMIENIIDDVPAIPVND